MWESLREVEERYERLNRDLGDPEVLSDQGRLQQAARAHAELEPVIAAIGYEILRFGAKHRANPLVKALMAPGILVQMITTKQPSDDQIEVAIVSMEQALEADGEQVPQGSELPERSRLEPDPAAAAA